MTKTRKVTKKKTNLFLSGLPIVLFCRLPVGFFCRFPVCFRLPLVFVVSPSGCKLPLFNKISCIQQSSRYSTKLPDAQTPQAGAEAVRARNGNP